LSACGPLSLGYGSGRASREGIVERPKSKEKPQPLQREPLALERAQPSEPKSEVKTESDVDPNRSRAARSQTKSKGIQTGAERGTETIEGNPTLEKDPGKRDYPDPETKPKRIRTGSREKAEEPPIPETKPPPPDRARTPPPSKPSKNLGGFAPRIFGWFQSPQGPPRPQRPTQQIPARLPSGTQRHGSSVAVWALGCSSASRIVFLLARHERRTSSRLDGLGHAHRAGETLVVQYRLGELVCRFPRRV
jgi:hypothetical protein